MDVCVCVCDSAEVRSAVGVADVQEDVLTQFPVFLFLFDRPLFLFHPLVILSHILSSLLFLLAHIPNCCFLCVWMSVSQDFLQAPTDSFVYRGAERR